MDRSKTTEGVRVHFFGKHFSEGRGGGRRRRIEILEFADDEWSACQSIIIAPMIVETRGFGNNIPCLPSQANEGLYLRLDDFRVTVVADFCGVKVARGRFEPILTRDTNVLKSWVGLIGPETRNSYLE